MKSGFIVFLFWLFVSLIHAAAAQAQTPSAAPLPQPAAYFYPFVIPSENASSDTATDVSFLADGPAGNHGEIVVKNGHFAESKTGLRIRFIGVNLSLAASYPTHADAEKIAASFAKQGINIVRLSSHDNNLDAQDRGDYLVYQFKQRGIYVDLRPAKAAWQKESARDYFLHVNPYTKQSYASDSCVALVEMNRENAPVAERADAEAMRVFLEKEVKVRAILIDSQAVSFGPEGASWESGTAFPHRDKPYPSFPQTLGNPPNQTTPRAPMVWALAKGEGPLALLAARRIADKPYVVFKTSAAAHNDFEAEGVPELAAFAAAQEWDAIFLSDYGVADTDTTNGTLQERSGSHFSLAAAAFLPAAALLFRTEALPQLRRSLRLEVPEAKVAGAEPLSHFWQQAKENAHIADLPPEDFLQYKTDFALVPDSGVARLVTNPNHISYPFYRFAQLEFAPDNGGSFSATKGKAEQPVVDAGAGGYARGSSGSSRIAERLENGICEVQTGFLGGKTISFGNAGKVTLGTWGNNFCAATLTNAGKDGNSLLLTLVGKVKNTDPAQAEFIPAMVTLFDVSYQSLKKRWDGITLYDYSRNGATVWALDGSGKRVHEIPATFANGTVTFSTAPKTASLWYEIVPKK